MSSYSRQKVADRDRRGGGIDRGIGLLAVNVKAKITEEDYIKPIVAELLETIAGSRRPRELHLKGTGAGPAGSR